MSKFPEGLLAALVALSVCPAMAGDFGLGRPATEAEIKAWDIDVRPDGQGLPQGRGDVATGEAIFTEQCAMCHGDFGEGVDRWPVLAGGQGTLTADRPVKTIGSYWPYLSTVWDYVHRAMPFGNAQSLEADEVYALTAYLLYLNDLVDEDFELSRESFAETRLPNEDNFFADDRAGSPVFAAHEACMENCKPTVQITARARVLDVTPETEEPSEAGAEAAPAFDPELAERGAKVWKKCKACHQLGADARNRLGPHLTDIVGREAGTAEEFAYSSALKTFAKGGLSWSEEALDAFLTKPKDFIKGTKMSFAGLRKPEDRLALIEYLKSQQD